jgi:HEAT repeat protein
LAKQGSQITRPLIDILYQPVDFSIHSNAIHTLGLIGDSDAISTILGFLEHTQFAYRQQAVITLGNWLQKQITSNEMKIPIVEALLRCLDDNCHDVRESAVFALKSEMNPQIIEKLIKVYAHEYEKQGFFIQEQIIEILTDVVNVLDILTLLLQSLLPMERIAVINILLWLGKPESELIIRKHYQSEKHSIVREIISSRIKNLSN